MSTSSARAAYRNIAEQRRFEIVYRDSRDRVTMREIIPAEIHLVPGMQRVQIVAKCMLRSGRERSFMSDQILSAVDLDSGATLDDLGAHLKSRD